MVGGRKVAASRPNQKLTHDFTGPTNSKRCSVCHRLADLNGIWCICGHEQHGVASCTSRLESQWETPNFDPRGVKTYGGIELKIAMINYLGV